MMSTSRKRDAGRKYESGAAKRKKQIARDNIKQQSGALLKYLCNVTTSCDTEQARHPEPAAGLLM